MTMTDLYSILPVLVLVVWALLLVLADLWFAKHAQVWTPIVAVVGLLLSLGASFYLSGQSLNGFGGLVLADAFSRFLQPLFAITGILAIGLAYDYLKRLGINRGEYYTLILFSISGMMLMASAGDLIMVFLSLELLSIPLYIMASMARPRLESEEAGLKYFLLGTFASGFLLFGIALVYGATGSTNLGAIFHTVSIGWHDPTLLIIGSVLILVALGFKVAAVPFQSWTPDVYQGAPSPVSAFMSVGVKAAGFAALLRVFLQIFPQLGDTLTPVFWVIAALTMIVGNVVAIAQSNLKRMLAYSSIAHAGYLLMAFVPFANANASQNSIAAALFYLLAYGLASLGAWAVLIGLEGEKYSGSTLDDLAGLSKTAPLSAALMTVFMLSFTGIPLTLGFWGKFYLFRTAIEGGFTGLAVIGLLTSLASAYYYLRVVVKMYFADGAPAFRKNYWTSVVAIFAGLALLVFSFVPGWFFDLAAKASLLGK